MLDASTFYVPAAANEILAFPNYSLQVQQRLCNE